MTSTYFTLNIPISNQMLKYKLVLFSIISKISFYFTYFTIPRQFKLFTNYYVLQQPKLFVLSEQQETKTKDSNNYHVIKAQNV